MKIVRKNVITTPTAKLATSPAASPTVCVHNAVARPSTKPRKLDATDEVDVSAVVGRVGRCYVILSRIGLVDRSFVLTKGHVCHGALDISLGLRNVEPEAA